MANRLRLHHFALTALLLPLIFSLGACDTTAPKPAPVDVAPVAPVAPVVPAVDTAKLAKEAAFRSMISLQNRLYRVATPLLISNPSLCRNNTQYLLGFTAKNKYSYSSEFIDNAQTILGLDEQLQIMDVMTGSGAASAGLQSGDKLVAINDTPMPQGPNADFQAGAVLKDVIGEKTSINLTINRSGVESSLKVPLTFACKFRVLVGNTDQVNSYADDLQVMVTKGMMNATNSDEELAYVLANEMGHNVLKHAYKLHTRDNTTKVINNLARLHPEPSSAKAGTAIKPTTPDLEIAADKRGLYMAARAGFSVAEANAFWSRLAAQDPTSEFGSYTSIHAITPARLDALTKVSSEIKAKQAAKKPLKLE